MKPFNPAARLSDKLTAMAFSLESGNGEAAVLFAAAEAIDAAESNLRSERDKSMYLRSTLADVAALLAGEQINTARPITDFVGEARARAAASVMAIKQMEKRNV